MTGRAQRNRRYSAALNGFCSHCKLLLGVVSTKKSMFMPYGTALVASKRDVHQLPGNEHMFQSVSLKSTSALGRLMLLSRLRVLLPAATSIDIYCLSLVHFVTTLNVYTHSRIVSIKKPVSCHG